MTSKFSAAEQQFMKRALALAARGRGRVSPNPMVGAVVVLDGVVVGEGHHVFSGRDHAEKIALERAGRSARGADLYVTLEPCSHHGRTPPCAEIIMNSGIRRVFVAVQDPNPRVCGAGISLLREHGVEVHVGLLSEEAARLNRHFFHFIQTGRPFGLLKLAMSMDGKIALKTGESQWITGPRARSVVHRLRYEFDSVLVGVGTVLVDDPALTVRSHRRKHITRVILDSHLRTPASARLFDSKDPVCLFHSVDAPATRRQELQKAGAHLEQVGRRGVFLDWSEIMGRLSKAGISSVLIEGGSRVAGSALRAGVVQRVRFFYGPVIFGGRDLSGVDEMGVRNMAGALRLGEIKMGKIGDDLWVEADVLGFGARARA